MSKLIAEIPYKDVHWIFIADYWNMNLSGTCIYNKKLCEFKAYELEYPEDWDEELDEWKEPIVEIYNLSFIEKIKWINRQKLFEWCIGYHWTYPLRRKFYYRKPIWFYKLLFSLYYISKQKI